MDNIRDIRKQMGLTQTEFGERLGIDQSTVSRLETGDLAVDKRTALAVTALAAIHEPAGLCGVCDLRLDHPSIGRCGEADCPHAQREADVAPAAKAA